MKRAWLAGMLIIPVVGCGPSYRVRVSSFADPNALAKSRYFLIPGKQNVDLNDLEFKEYSKFAKNALNHIGYKEAESPADVDVMVALNWNAGSPERIPYSFSLPLMGQTGGGSSTFNSTSLGSNGRPSYTTGRISQEPTFGVIGTQNISGVSSFTPLFVWFIAYDANAYRDNKTLIKLWETWILAMDRRSDLRQAMPYLVAAGRDYFAKNTGKYINVNVSDLSGSVSQVKGIEVEATKHNPLNRR